MCFDSEIMSKCAEEHGCLYGFYFIVNTILLETYRPYTTSSYFSSKYFQRPQGLRDSVGYKGLVGPSHLAYSARVGSVSDADSYRRGMTY